MRSMAFLSYEAGTGSSLNNRAAPVRARVEPGRAVRLKSDLVFIRDPGIPQSVASIAISAC
jgi:hypothetical protein